MEENKDAFELDGKRQIEILKIFKSIVDENKDNIDLLHKIHDIFVIFAEIETEYGNGYARCLSEYACELARFAMTNDPKECVWVDHNHKVLEKLFRDDD